MIHSFEGDSADSVWRDAAAAVLSQGSAQSSRGGPTHELLHVALQIRDPRQRWIVSRREALNIAFALAETLWIISGRNDAAFVNYFNSKLPQYAGTEPTYHGAYGWRLRKHIGFDQLRRAVDILKRNPNSRQVVLDIWDSRIDLPFEDGQPRSKDIPCNLVSMLKVRGTSLDWTQIMRSNDAYRGLPHNIVQFTTLQEIIAGWLGLQPGLYTHWSDSLHFYNTDTIEYPILNTPATLPANRDSLALNIDEFERMWPCIERLSDLMINLTISADEIGKNVQNAELPVVWHDVMKVLAAEAVRRRHGEPEEIAKSICSPTFRALWQRWIDRIEEAKRKAMDATC